MSDFRNFFPDKIDKPKQEKYKLKRFPKEIEASPLTAATMANLRKAATKTTKGKRGAKLTETDMGKFTASVLAASICVPDLNNAELQQAWGVMGAESLANEMFLAGESDELFQWIMDISGYEEDEIEELVEEAKN